MRRSLHRRWPRRQLAHIPRIVLDDHRSLEVGCCGLEAFQRRQRVAPAEVEAGHAIVGIALLEVPEVAREGIDIMY